MDPQDVSETHTYAFVLWCNCSVRDAEELSSPLTDQVFCSSFLHCAFWRKQKLIRPTEWSTPGLTCLGGTKAELNARELRVASREFFSVSLSFVLCPFSFFLFPFPFLLFPFCSLLFPFCSLLFPFCSLLFPLCFIPLLLCSLFPCSFFLVSFPFLLFLLPSLLLFLFLWLCSDSFHFSCVALLSLPSGLEEPQDDLTN